MIFGLIDFINLLPLYTHFKKSSLPSYTKKTIDYKKTYPSKLNQALKKRQIHAAIISSIESNRQKYKNLNIGICANKKVLSVLVEKNSNFSLDFESATSNMLSRVLGLNGKVIIGDKALKSYLDNGKENYIDMCSKWYEKTKLPFCFARFSYIANHNKLNKTLKTFNKNSNTKNKRVKIPNYILDKYSKSRQISQKDIKIYLEHIYYTIDKKEQKALKLYTKKVSFLNYKS